MLTDPKARKVFEVMIDRGLIPAEGTFDVTDNLLESSFNIYAEVFPRKSKAPIKKSNKDFSKRLAGLNMLKLNLERVTANEEVIVKRNKSQVKCGFVYVITNEAYPGYFKIGMTSDVNKRLSTYQTYDPLRRYKIEHYSFVEDRRAVEKELLKKYQLDVEKGEWVTDENIKKAIIEL